jgi:glyoxylase-like metal-dependent hydrolase (beta-lactamase superfamily II)
MTERRSRSFKGTEMLRKLTGLLALLLASPVHAEAAERAFSPDGEQVAPGVWLVPGGIRPDRQPDGNSVVFDAPAGLVVIDTGRHAWHRRAILSLARAQGRNIVAIVNTHWHLDHVSGNPDLRAAYPGLRVHASNAIDGALAGFLAASARDSAEYLGDPGIPESMREDIRADMLTIENGAALRPDVVIGGSGTMTIGGRAFGIRLAQDAVTAGDVWLYDEASRIAVLGDLVTLPAPFLDTACPGGWKNALAEVAATPFEVAIPGHGTPMTHAQFEQYRRAFGAFIECSASTRPAGECGAQWVDSVESLLVDAASDKPRAQGMAEYYVGMLRANGGRSEYCRAAKEAR